MTLGRTMLPSLETVDVTVSVIANDNVELACAFIQKKAVEKVRIVLIPPPHTHTHVKNVRLKNVSLIVRSHGPALYPTVKLYF